MVIKIHSQSRESAPEFMMNESTAATREKRYLMVFPKWGVQKYFPY
jgi:hypothetical protein